MTLPSDEQHEQRIQEAYQAWMHARDMGYSRLAARRWCAVVRLIGERSPERVKQMEAERGLT